MKYALHDTKINNIVSNNEEIELYFAEGIYLLGEEGKEAELSDPCRMLITINGFNCSKPYEHITVIKAKKSKVTEIDFADFIKLVEENSFDIDIDYYSFFGAAILLKGYCGKYGIELTLMDVDKVEYFFEK